MSKRINQNESHAQAMARLANHTYHLNSVANDIDALQAKLAQMDLSLERNPGNPFYDLPSGHHGFIAVNATQVVIAIRGSGEADDWRNNLRYWQEAHGVGGHVHAGFALAAAGITRAIQTELQRTPERYAGKPLWLTGHSSGGSVAILVGEALAAQQIMVDGIYTFGAPMVGDRAFAYAYPLRPRIHAFATLGDLVPLLPAPWLTWRSHRLCIQWYHHVVTPHLLIGKTVSLRAALAHFRHERSTLLEKIVGALIDFSPHSLVAAYIPNLPQTET